MKKKNNKFYSQIHPFKYPILSEPLQTCLVDFYYAIGLRPEIGLIVEYLSWNKEQRLYMAWLRDMYLFMDREVQSIEKIAEDNKIKLELKDKVEY